MVLTARGEAAWITRGEMARTARGETATAAATGHSRAAAAPEVRLRARWVPFRAGVNALGVSLGGPRGHGAIFRGRTHVPGVRVHRAPRVRTFGRPPPAHPVASRRREEARAPRGRAPCRHNSTSQQSTSCVSVSGFAAVGVRNPTGDRANFQSEFACASSVAFICEAVDFRAAPAATLYASLCLGLYQNSVDLTPSQRNSSHNKRCGRKSRTS